MSEEIHRIIRNILSDIRVELSDEFDRNFERESFFSEGWARRKSPVRGGRSGHLLVDTGGLRQSIQSRSDEGSITFFSTVAYAGIHNEGGEIKVTAKMKRYFWARYYEATGGFGRRKDGSSRQNARNRRLTSEAEFWKLMALMKVGSTVKIPRRRFLGSSPEVEKAVREIIEENLRDYFVNEYTRKI
ncbi:MAG: phage virion morphogenesis protein [Bacteroidaceae bacterium]|nr:phage virion morphogenesis protein [Bacteroidaceae bacterium]